MSASDLDITIEETINVEDAIAGSVVVQSKLFGDIIRKLPNADVTVSVEDPEGVIKAGMFAEVRLTAVKKENVVAVPSDAVITSGSEKKIVLLNQDGTVTVKKVTVGIDNGDLAEITSGIKVGDKIVVKGQTYVKDGEMVNEVE